MRVETFSVEGMLEQGDPSYAQVNADEIVLCGGFPRGDITRVSDAMALFSCRTKKLFKLPPMPKARYKHAVVVVGEYVYCIGGGN